MARPVAALGGILRARFGQDLNAGPEGLWVALQRGCGDSSAAEEDLGIAWRPFEDSIADTVRWIQHEHPVAA